MAQTKRRRRSKHRGTAAGTIEARGRTGRPPTAEERKRQSRAQAREKRLNTPPTWRSSATRAALATGLIFVFLLATGATIAAAVGFAVVAMAIYVPAGYYLELFLFRRRQRRGKAPGR